MKTSLWKAVALGAVFGFGIASLPSCGGTKPIVRCNSDTCDGCCDDTGTCQLGTSLELCGSLGATCNPCPTGQVCQAVVKGGQCQLMGQGGGSGGGTGGGAGGGATGGGTGGGATGGGGGSSDGGACGPGTCSGCCTPAGSCIANPTPSRCGSNGESCVACASGNTCVGGACTACSGCVDLNTGTCAGGTIDTACGRNGQFCQACDTGAGRTCNAGVCTGGTCDATSCPDGCCDGTNCVAKTSMTNAQCGPGVGGAQCIACDTSTGQTCDTAQGICVGGPSTDGGIFPGFDGGLPDLCTLAGTPCATGQCCDVILCVSSGSACFLTGGTCNSGTCQ